MDGTTKTERSVPPKCATASMRSRMWAGSMGSIRAPASSMSIKQSRKPSPYGQTCMPIRSADKSAIVKTVSSANRLPNQDWEGAMTTIQRWAIDPLLNWQGHDRTLRTVFTHDHLGPSTHQQVGLYAGVLVEPQGSQWYLPDGVPMNTRADGGPTSWQAMIVTADPQNFAS